MGLRCKFFPFQQLPEQTLTGLAKIDRATGTESLLLF